MTGEIKYVFLIWNKVPQEATAGGNEKKKLTLGDDSLHTDHAAQQAGGQSSWGDVLGSEAALQPNIKLLMLLSEGGVHRGNQLLQGLLECQQLLKGGVHKSGRGERTYKAMDI